MKPIKGRKGRAPLVFKKSQIIPAHLKPDYLRQKLMKAFNNDTKAIQHYLNAVLTDL